MLSAEKEVLHPQCLVLSWDGLGTRWSLGKRVRRRGLGGSRWRRSSGGGGRHPRGRGWGGQDLLGSRPRGEYTVRFGGVKRYFREILGIVFSGFWGAPKRPSGVKSRRAKRGSGGRVSWRDGLERLVQTHRGDCVLSDRDLALDSLPAGTPPSFKLRHYRFSPTFMEWWELRGLPGARSHRASRSCAPL